jgi:molybdate transport system substrate-binding protein
MRAPPSVLALAVWLGMSVFAQAAEPVRLYSAGSLRAALTEVAAAFASKTGVKVEPKFGPSGTLRNEIAAGAPAQVFASANMKHPQALAESGKSGPVVLFARNRLCGLARAGLAVDTSSLLDRALDPAVKLGTSTPRADPAGDYAWELFRKADTLRAGARAALEGKALQLVGGPDAATAPPGHSVYSMLIAQGRADLILTYCTNALEARIEDPGLQIVQLPPELAVAADYGMAVMTGAPAEAYRFAMFILSAEGQRALAAHGFAAPALPGQ